MSSSLKAAVWLVVSWACYVSAQPAYTPPALKCLPLYQAGVKVGCTDKFTMQGADFVITCTGGSCTVSLDTSVTKLGATIGESTDFGASVDMSSSYLTMGSSSTTADSGAIRLDNATSICWEASPAGTDQCISVDASEILTYNGAASISTSVTTPIVYGGTGSGGNMTIAATSNATQGTVTIDSPVALYPSIPDDRGTTNFVAIAPTFDDTGTANDTTAYGILFNPTFTGSSSGTTGTNQLGAIKATGTYTFNATGVVLPNAQSYLFYDARAITSARTNTSADIGRTVFSQATTTLSGNSGVWGEVTGFRNEQTARTTGAVAGTFTSMTGFYDAPLVTTDTIGGTVTVTDRLGADVADVSASGAGTETITNNYGVRIKAMSTGTNVFPLAFGEHAITGTVKSGEGVVGVASGSPNRLYFKNESGHTWYAGWANWSMSSATLGADNGTDYFRLQGFAQAAGATEASVDDVSPPGPAKIYAIACNARVAPANGGGTQSRTCTLKVGTPGSMSASALTCSFSEATQSCTDREEAGVSVAATQVATIEMTAANTPADSEVSVTVWWNLDAF